MTASTAIRHTSGEDAGWFRDTAVQALSDHSFVEAADATLNWLLDVTREFPTECYAFIPRPGTGNAQCWHY